MKLNLLFHNIGFALDTLIALYFAVFVYLKNRKAVVNITFALAFVSIAFFTGSHVIGVNISDPYLSRSVLMWNISVIWVACFLTHCSFALIDVIKQQKVFLYFMYAGATILTIIYIIFPDTFLLPSVPKMYFPNYYVYGPLQLTMRIIFSVGVPVYFLSVLFKYYRKADVIMKNRVKYFFASLTLGYLVGSLAILLVYDIPIDPLFASPAVIILAVPMAYAIIKYNLMDIRILAKKALVYGSAIAISSFCIFMIGYINTTLVEMFPVFPFWLTPLLAGCLATFIGIFVWHRIREGDILKYEFITIMTHKLRTPLTSIKWSAENVKNFVNEEGHADLNRIKESVAVLVELTNTIAGMSSEDEDQYVYNHEQIDLTSLCRETVGDYDRRIIEKGISVSLNLSNESIFIKADKVKIKTMLQILMENAITYTPKDGKITISLSKENTNALIKISDTGIGMSKDELKMIFSKFFRTGDAKKSDTEGMGIGLYIARRIAEHHNGTIWCHSEGLGKGSTFFISMPIIK